MAARGDIPIALERDSARAEWTSGPESVDFGRTLPLMLHGLRASDLHLRAVAEQCALDLLEACPERAANCVPQAIPAVKRASGARDRAPAASTPHSQPRPPGCLNTRDPDVVVRAMRVLQELATCPGAGPALITFYRQLLPVLNIFQAKYRARRTRNPPGAWGHRAFCGPTAASRQLRALIHPPPLPRGGARQLPARAARAGSPTRWPS